MVKRPILFNTEMVQAILEGTKTQTRRLIKKKYENTDIEWFTNKYWTRLVEMQNDVPEPIVHEDGRTSHKVRAYKIIEPPYKVGDIHWVREKFNGTETNSILYAADKDFIDCGCKEVDGYLFMESEIKWKPSIHMPRAAARIFLKVTDVRAERIQDISEEDAIKEGCQGIQCEKEHDFNLEECCSDCNNSRYIVPPQLEFLYLWDSIYHNWNENPWVWVIEFERVNS